MRTKTTFIQNIRVGEKVGDFFLAAEKNTAFSQKGSPYVNLRLRDRTGEIDAKIWDNVPELEKVFRKGDIVYVEARVQSYRDTPQLNILSVRPAAEGEVDPLDFFPATPYDVETMYAELLRIMETITSAPLKALLAAFFGDADFAKDFRRAPAAKGFHHSYLGGLLEHTLSVTRLLADVAPRYPEMDRDLLIAGGILHDIGKVREFSYDGLVEYSNEGRLVGHIVIGVEMMDEKLSALPGFPAGLAMNLRHILLSHHGVLEFGSPKRPKTLEALMVHHLDDMDAKLHAFQEFMRTSGDEDSEWTAYHRLLERYIYKGKGTDAVQG